MPIFVPSLHLSGVDDALESRWHYLPQFSYARENTQRCEITTPNASFSAQSESAPKDIDKLQEEFSSLEIAPNKGWCTLI